jgi:hypothetical protein
VIVAGSQILEGSAHAVHRVAAIPAGRLTFRGFLTAHRLNLQNHGSHFIVLSREEEARLDRDLGFWDRR